MMKKIMLWMLVFVLNLSVAFAQTGLFESGVASSFAVTGVTIVVVILVGKEIFKRFSRRK